MQAAIAGVSIYIVRSSTIIWGSPTTTRTSLSAAEILEYQKRKKQEKKEKPSN